MTVCTTKAIEYSRRHSLKMQAYKLINLTDRIASTANGPLDLRHYSLSNISHNFVERSCIENGLLKKSSPLSRTPWGAITSAGYPDM